LKKGSVSQAVQHLQSLCQETDPLVVHLLQTLPTRVQTDQGGALSVPELQVRFEVMREEVRKAALAPEAAPKLVGQLVGSVLAAIAIAPKGFVAGQGTEEILSRAAYYVDRGKIQEALRELENVQGYSKVLMEDWVEFARERLVVDQVLRTLKADAILRHKSFQL
jgi:MICOS complex subunit MIC60